MILKAIALVIIVAVIVLFFNDELFAVDSILSLVFVVIALAFILSAVTAIMEAISKDDDIELGELIIRVILGIIAFLALINFIIK